MMKVKIFFLLTLLLTSCSDSSNPTPNQIRKNNLTGSNLSQLDPNININPEKAVKKPTPIYPWESDLVGNHPKITKEYFRCKGSSLNPEHTEQTKDGFARYFDCGGADRHGLPLKNEQEFIYPILVDLLNYLQVETGKQVVITSGHRCPTHNTYVDPSKENIYSKHMIGAEVSFYLRGIEDQPEEIVRLLQEYYVKMPKYENRSEFVNFQRYEKSDTNVSIKPWYNKEIYIKLFQEEEGRNFDNRHPYPYIGVQVRWDSELKDRVSYTWQKAHYSFLRK